jgi:hypothetical protein
VKQTSRYSTLDLFQDKRALKGVGFTDTRNSYPNRQALTGREKITFFTHGKDSSVIISGTNISLRHPNTSNLIERIISVRTNLMRTLY